MRSPINHHRGRVAGLSRDREPTDPDLVAARRDLKTEVLAEYIEKTVAAAPPLTPEQRARLVQLLQGGDAA